MTKKDLSFARVCEYLLCAYVREGQCSPQFYSSRDTWLTGARGSAFYVCGLILPDAQPKILVQKAWHEPEKMGTTGSSVGCND